jgi:putative transposase
MLFGVGQSSHPHFSKLEDPHQLRRDSHRSPGRTVDQPADPQPPDELGDHAENFRFLVRDRAGQLTETFDAILASTGITAVKSHPEALARMLTRKIRAHRPDRGHRPDADPRRTTPEVSPGRVRPALHGRRPHRGRQLRPPQPDHPVADFSQERIKRRAVLGGLINEYERAA